MRKNPKDYLEQRFLNKSGSVGIVEYPNVDKSGWVLIEPETDELYGKVQWRDEYGTMKNKFEVVELNYKQTRYIFCKSGLGELIIVNKIV